MSVSANALLLVPCLAMQQCWSRSTRRHPISESHLGGERFRSCFNLCVACDVAHEAIVGINSRESQKTALIKEEDQSKHRRGLGWRLRDAAVARGVHLVSCWVGGRGENYYWGQND